MFNVVRCDLLSERAVGNGLTAELDLERVGSRLARCIHHADAAVAVVDNVDVDVAVDIAADATRDATVARLRRVQVDDALLAHRDARPHRV